MNLVIENLTYFDQINQNGFQRMDIGERFQGVHVRDLMNLAGFWSQVGTWSLFSCFLNCLETTFGFDMPPFSIVEHFKESEKEM